MKDWKKTTIKKNDSLEKAIKVLHLGGLRLALVVDDKMKLLGTITDGDIRRAILDHLPMSTVIEEVMSKDPLTALISDSEDAVMSKMRSRDLLHIPIVDKDDILVGLKTLQDLTYNNKLHNPVVIMAGGFGKRLHPLTEDLPKPLLEVGGHPILETILSRFIKYGFHNFYISTYYKAHQIHNYFGDGSSLGVNINYINEDKPLGTAGSIALLPENLPDLPILMMNGDVLTNVNFEHLLNFHQEHNGIATLCIREYDVQIPFGVVDIKKQKAKKFLEKPVKKFFVNAGIYVFERDLINRVNSGQYIDMPTLLENQINDGYTVNVFPIHEYWKDVGHMEEYKSVNNAFNNGFSLDD